MYNNKVVKTDKIPFHLDYSSWRLWKQQKDMQSMQSKVTSRWKIADVLLTLFQHFYLMTLCWCQFLNTWHKYKLAMQFLVYSANKKQTTVQKQTNIVITIQILSLQHVAHRCQFYTCDSV